MAASQISNSRSGAASPPPDARWDEAFLLVESYLRAHQQESRIVLNRLATEIIGEARRRVEADPSTEPVAAALDVAQARIGAWFVRCGLADDWSNERVRAHNRLALALARLPGGGSNALLATEQAPPGLRAAMAAFQFQSGPELQLTAMPPASLDLGAEDGPAPHGNARRVPRWARTVGAGLMIAALIGVAWAAIH